MEIEKIPLVIIGGGVVGCAIAEAFSRTRTHCILLESSPRIAEGTTSRNSGVVHAGLYYPPGSLKAELCVRGQHLLYEWCRQKNVPHRKMGKWIVGSSDDEESLFALTENAKNCGVTSLRWVSKAELQTQSSAIIADHAVYSESSGIVDPYEFTASLMSVAGENGADLMTDVTVTSITASATSGFCVGTNRGDIFAERVVNSAGLYADAVANLAGINKYKIHPWRGEYFQLSPRYRFPHLIYPTKRKNAPGLGIHLTADLDGGWRLGPDVEFWPSKEDFSVPEPSKLSLKKNTFFEAASKYIRGLKIEDLSYSTCGIRPKIRAPSDQQESDFIISEDLPGFINLVGIESPGLTAAMAIAENVMKLLF